MRVQPRTWRVILLASLAIAAGSASASESECGSLQNAFGPFDYRDTTKVSELRLVESGHFNADVRTLRRGLSSVSPINDLDYTLRAFPNHWGALDAVARFALSGGNFEQFWSADCYFDRAVRFAANDGNVHLLHGIYLMRSKRDADAIKSMEMAARLSPDSVDVAYNLGLLYLRRGEHEKALESARIAYGKGYPLPGLRNALREAGVWKDP